ncbi:sensor histidine kinase [Synechococcus elongatus]|uniref:histidine kinase n=2 Tax=Synechococcus elongatus TaxID=32046 RepID=Q31M17_SYNE7|nr:ATP-binding protein [Synechococcus elongatus]ABB57902.1 histidine kinase [Synechococcus elongatus PCC 7942 = FACHB-805]AJD57617.1 ATPase [Synechococcus elongatus UTEX 2973]MBD2586619.1 HAMP domain-containing protein [Synechococcus elongatus FACHB-242]MBD2687693.1 HAMP domain-containing protein [Synechococcus elongatus FACHB-1061]MBD2706597.1 HAMP domain-containing protein [Synechococcus elongatus PCC 7942 = FACHB-805]
MFRHIQSIFNKLGGSRVATNSLQFRLTLELTLISALGVCSITLWSSWRLEQTLINGYKQNLSYISDSFPEIIKISSLNDSIQLELERSIAQVSKPRLLIWVRSPRGELLARSRGMNIPSSDLIEVANKLPASNDPKVFQIQQQSFILAQTALSLDGNPIGNVYWLQDITEDQRQLDSLFSQLQLGSILLVFTLIVVIASRIRRAMAPIKEISQIASNISIIDLGADPLELRHAPEEILGLAKAFNDMLNRLSISWEQQQQFVGNVSHELKTPLTVISGYLQSLLRRGDNLNSYQNQALETASAEAERTIRMLQDLLDLARVDSGNLHFRLMPTVLNTLIAEVAEMTRRVTGRQIIMQTPKSEIVVYADQNRLEQALINLLDNAAKYSNQDQVVYINLEQSNQQTLIHIIDQGVGIPLAHQSRIFERFYRVDEAMTRSRDGTGLGLAIAKSLIEGMQGKITLRSKLGEGSTFTIILPNWESLP